MSCVVLEPTPAKCVETVARDRYWRQVDACMKVLAREGNAEALEEEIETLRLFLETSDVAAIRHRAEELMDSGGRVRVVLKREPGNELVVNVTQQLP